MVEEKKLVKLFRALSVAFVLGVMVWLVAIGASAQEKQQPSVGESEFWTGVDAMEEGMNLFKDDAFGVYLCGVPIGYVYKGLNDERLHFIIIPQVKSKEMWLFTIFNERAKRKGNPGVQGMMIGSHGTIINCGDTI